MGSLFPGARNDCQEYEDCSFREDSSKSWHWHQFWKRGLQEEWDKALPPPTSFHGVCLPPLLGHSSVIIWRTQPCLCGQILTSATLLHNNVHITAHPCRGYSCSHVSFPTGSQAGWIWGPYPDYTGIAGSTTSVSAVKNAISALYILLFLLWKKRG